MANVFHDVRRVLGITSVLIAAFPAAPAWAQDGPDRKESDKVLAASKGHDADAPPEAVVGAVFGYAGETGATPEAGTVGRTVARPARRYTVMTPVVTKPAPRPYVRDVTAPGGVYVHTFREPADTTLGMTLEPVSDAARAQLGVPAGQGAVVFTITPDGPAAMAGLLWNDILLTVAGKPVGSADELTKQLKAAGESAVPLKLIREGKPQTLQIRPVYRVTLGPVKEEKTDYYLGVNATEADDTLRAHIKTLGGKGLVVNEVVAGSPAEKAGVKPNDILVKLGEKTLDSTDALAAQVRALRDKSATLLLLRAGKLIAVAVTPTPRTVEANPQHDTLRIMATSGGSADRARPTVNVQSVRHVEKLDKAAELPFQYQRYLEKLFAAPGNALAEADNLRARLDGLEAEMKGVRKAMEEVRDALKSARPHGRD